MTSEAKIPGTPEAWETGALGRDKKHTRKAPAELAAQIDEALGLQAISIRLPRAVIETYKMLAKMHGVGYQPLMRDALCRFADSETRLLLQGAAEEQRQQKSRAAAVKKGAVAKASESLAPTTARAPTSRRPLKKAA